jgi:hypothetical protein
MGFLFWNGGSNILSLTRHLNRRYPTINVIVFPPERKLEGKVIFNNKKIVYLFVSYLNPFIGVY